MAKLIIPILLLPLASTSTSPLSKAGDRPFSPQPTKLTWSRLSLHIKKRRILSTGDASIEARAGRLLGILGPSGAGKTTLLSVFAGTLCLT